MRLRAIPALLVLTLLLNVSAAALCAQACQPGNGHSQHPQLATAKAQAAPPAHGAHHAGHAMPAPALVETSTKPVSEFRLAPECPAHFESATAYSPKPLPRPVMLSASAILPAAQTLLATASLSRTSATPASPSPPLITALRI